jgi:hypothetical protein
MKRWLGLALAFLAGCSTAPVADVLDFFKPGKLAPEQTAPYGGVCVPRQVPNPPNVAVAPPPGAPGPIVPAPTTISPPASPALQPPTPLTPTPTTPPPPGAIPLQ